ncbi:granulocyte-macrophage colony-stimulating factor receptor subunit alpha-like isoform X2 [Saccopteryx bilineata]|uniref:granulocyte-macrophage colony-stimulating factor receptor subunit alpha-like isoform X2 n=1 Tax=Saccopteryx bilineata TaxID=59482 RepID=UPI00338EB82D
MARVLGLASLLLLLSPVACCADSPPVTTPENASPVTNMTVHPRKKMFSWNYQRNVTEHRCQLDTPPNSTTRQSPRVRGDHTYFCHFPNAVLHRGATFTVHVTAEGHPYRSVLDFRNPGKEGSGAVNFSCRIHHVRLMTCSWTPGPAAPTDVQYRLYRWSSMRDEDEVECPHYTAAPAGTHIGCRFGEFTEPRQKAYSFLVTGTSEQTPVPFLDFGPLKTIEMEKPDPPANLTVLHNGSHHIIQWDNPRTGSDVASGALYYELDIHREGSSSQEEHVFQRGNEINVYVMPSSASGAQHRVRIRVRFVRSELWSDWTVAKAFGPQKQGFPKGLYALVMIGLGLAMSFIFFTVKIYNSCKLERESRREDGYWVSLRKTPE